MDWLAECHDNVTDWDIRSWCWWHVFPTGQQYKVAMSARYDKSVPILIRSYMLLGRKTPATNHAGRMPGVALHVCNQLAFSVEGPEFESRSSQTSDLYKLVLFPT